MANRPLDPKVRQALKKMKSQVASELGIKSDPVGDKGNLKSRANGNYGGSLGGTMTRKLIEVGERELMKNHK